MGGMALVRRYCSVCLRCCPVCLTSATFESAPSILSVVCPPPPPAAHPAVSEAETDWSDGVAYGYRAATAPQLQQPRLGVGFAALMRRREVWAICAAQYASAWVYACVVGIPSCLTPAADRTMTP